MAEIWHDIGQYQCQNCPGTLAKYQADLKRLVIKSGPPDYLWRDYTPCVCYPNTYWLWDNHPYSYRLHWRLGSDEVQSGRETADATRTFNQNTTAMFLLGKCILRDLLRNVYKLNTNAEVTHAISERHAVHRWGIQSHISARAQSTYEVLNPRTHKRYSPRAKPCRRAWSSVQIQEQAALISTLFDLSHWVWGDSLVT